MRYKQFDHQPLMDLNSYFILGETLKIAENMCQEFALSSYGIVRRLYPGLIGDYLLQSERNNGRVLYRSKDEVIWDQRSGYIYLYSFEYDEAFKVFSDIWLVSFIKSATIIKP